MRHKVFFSCLVFALCIGWMFIKQIDESISKYSLGYWLPQKSGIGPWKNQGRYCYKNDSSVIIFLHLTNKSIRWTPIEECAFKLAAIHNNDTGVCVLTSFPMESSPALSALPNLEISWLNVTEIFHDTPLHHWHENYTSGNATPSKIWLWELSDALRYAYLYKYGGKYMDTDSWTLRNLAGLKNVAGWQDDYIANGVLFFEHHHPFMEAIVTNFEKYFSPGSWGSSGPDLVTKIYESREIDPTTYEIAPWWYFYPLYYMEYNYAYESNLTDEVKDRIKDSFAIHLWGHAISVWYKKPYQNESFVDEVLRTVCSQDDQFRG